MPSKTPKQARFMRAVAHGWKPSRVEAPPVSVAQEFVDADRKYSGGFAENRYSRGGLSAMGEVDAGSERQRPLNQLHWQEGGDVDYQVEPGVYEAPNVEEMGPALEQMFSDMGKARDARNKEVIDYTWDKTKPLEMETQLDDRLAAMSGPEQVEYVKPRLLAAMKEMKLIGESPFGKRYSYFDYGQSQKQVNLWRDKWSKALQQQAREAEGEEKGMQRGGRVIPLQPGNSGHIRRAALEAEGYTYNPNTNSMHAPEQTIATDAAETPTYDPYYGAGPDKQYNNAWNLPPDYMNWRGDARRGVNGGHGPRNGGPRGGGGPGGGGPGDGGGGPGGPSEPPPRIEPRDPASYVGASSDTSERGSKYRKKLRQHQQRIEEILGTGNAEGGPVNYYQEGGEVRPGHAEGPNPYNKDDPLLRKSYARWEAKHHIDPAPPPPPPEAAPAEEDGGGIAAWLRSYFMPDPETANVAKIEAALEREGQAYGGRVGYQTGGLAIAAPAGGVPPWIEPTGTGPGYMDEPQGYQFGGAARQYRGVPPQRTPMQPGGGGRFSSRFQRRAPGGGGMMSRVGGRPQRGGLAAMQQQAQQQQAGFAGRLPPGIDPQAVAANPEGYAQWAADPRSAGARGVPTKPMPGPSGPYNPGPVVNLPPPSPGGTVYDQNWPPRGPMAPGGDPFAPGEGIPGGGNIPPWKRLPGGRPQVPPSPGGEITGGPRVPPNQRGYLQKQRMMNRPPSGPVGGGGGNRVGMADQQGALARAMQKGTGRAPMSRRMAFGRGAQQ